MISHEIIPGLSTTLFFACLPFAKFPSVAGILLEKEPAIDALYKSFPFLAVCFWFFNFPVRM